MLSLRQSPISQALAATPPFAMAQTAATVAASPPLGALPPPTLIDMVLCDHSNTLTLFSYFFQAGSSRGNYFPGAGCHCRSTSSCWCRPLPSSLLPLPAHLTLSSDAGSGSGRCQHSGHDRFRAGPGAQAALARETTAGACLSSPLSVCRFASLQSQECSPSIKTSSQPSQPGSSAASTYQLPQAETVVLYSIL
jgi:hypothetical protein